MTQQFRITDVKAREIIDGRGTPTIEVDVWVNGSLRGRADVPCGRSTGSYEAHEMRDGDERYGGKGVRTAVNNISQIIAPVIIDQDVTRQRYLDNLMVELDGTPRKSKLGANAIVGVSLGIARAAASSLGIPLYKYINANAHILPVPMMNLINGGKLASNDLDFQEFIVMPVGATSFSQALEITDDVNRKLGEILLKKYGKLALNVGDEGGYVPPITSIREAMDALQRAVQESGWESAIVYALDVAATHLYDKQSGKYTVEGKKLSTGEFIDLYKELCATYPMVSIEDPLDEDDFEGFARITQELGIQIVGDDLFVTNSQRLGKGIEMKAANALLWKFNQIGTLSEALDAAELAFRNRYGVVVSERSGETEDSSIADFAVALDAGQIKTGAPVRAERTSKYNQLLRIEEELGSAAKYAGRRFNQPY